MSLWTPYLEGPMDLSKQKPPKRAKLTHDWPLHEESSNPEDYLREMPAYSPIRDSAQDRVPVYSPIGDSALEHVPGYSPVRDNQERVPVLSPHKNQEGPVYSPLRDTSSPGSITSEGHVTEDPEYQAFERDALRAMAQSGRIVQNNPRMRRDIQSSQTDHQYRQQRQRNNLAAKMSRDRRKMREVKLGIQVAYLTRKLLELQNRLAEQMYEQPYLTSFSGSLYRA